MLGININQRLDELIQPARHEIRAAEEKVFERIRQLFRDAENEVQWKGQHMSAEQRMESAERELEKAEEQLLSAISSMYKAMCYVVPEMISRVNFLSLKDIEAKRLMHDKPTDTRLEKID